jgi:hypothetical protein
MNQINEPINQYQVNKGKFGSEVDAFALSKQDRLSVLLYELMLCLTGRRS